MLNSPTRSLLTHANEIWDKSIIPTLFEYIKIPNKSPAYDANWENNGYMEQAVTLLSTWCQQQNLAGMQLTVHRAPGKTPLIFIDIPGQLEETVLLYGHLDKQPEMTGWQPGLGPWQPVLKEGRLYGRGAADDGYAIFAAITAIKLLQVQNLPHARCVILIEASEESASYDLPFYIDQLKPQLRSPSLVICLDSGCGNYEQLWCTTSLRGLVNASLKVQVLDEGVHSGNASGVVPSSFRILRQLLSRIEDETSGIIKLPALNVTIPPDRLSEARATAITLNQALRQQFPFTQQTQAASTDDFELVLNRTWRPTLSITGIDDIPPLHSAGNVLRPATTAMLSIRLPPTCDAQTAAINIQQCLLTEPPYQAKVSVTIKDAATGWNAPATQAWLAAAINSASLNYYGKEAMYWGEGGTIPFMGMLGKIFPAAQFMITGVLGPNSNAHGPNEFLDINMAKKLTCCIADVLVSHYRQANKTV